MTRIGRILRASLRSDGDWQRQARLYIAICPHLVTLPPRHQYSCVKKIQRRLWGVPLVLCMFLVGAATAIAGVYVLIGHLPFSASEFLSSALGFILLMFTVNLLPVGIRWAAAKAMPNRLRRIVRECVNAYSDLQVCTECGYDLRGQTEPRCPECGRPSAPAHRPR